MNRFSEHDLDELKLIHRKFYEDEFSLSDFLSHLNGVTIRNEEDGSIVLCGGIRPIIECVLITDKSKSVRERRYALHRLLEIARYATKSTGHNQLHAFVQDDNWERHLGRAGFNRTRGQALVLDI